MSCTDVHGVEDPTCIGNLGPSKALRKQAVWGLDVKVDDHLGGGLVQVRHSIRDVQRQMLPPSAEPR